MSQRLACYPIFPLFRTKYEQWTLKMFLHIIDFSSMFDGLIASTLGLIVYFCTDYLPYVVTLLLPEVPSETSQLATFLLLPLRSFCCLSEVAIRIYVYFKISNLSNVLISSSTIAILIFSYIFTIVSAFLLFVLKFSSATLFFPTTFSLLLRSFFVPANVLVSQDGIIQIFINNLQELQEDFKDFMTFMLNAGRASWHFLKLD